MTFLKKIFLKTIQLYQRSNFFYRLVFKAIFLTYPACRFQPTCSEYSFQAIEKYGIIRGSWLALKRISKCHPGSKGGKDLLK